AVLVKPDGPRSVRPLRHKESKHRQPHAYERELAVGDLPRCGGHHQLAERVAACGGFGLGASGHGYSMFPFGATHFGSRSWISFTSFTSSACGKVSFTCSA